MLSPEDLEAIRSLDKGIRTWLMRDQVATWERVAGPLLALARAADPPPASSELSGMPVGQDDDE